MRHSERVISAKQVTYIQAMRRRLGIPDEIYNEMKRSVGAESTRDLTVLQFEDLLQRMGGSAAAKNGKESSSHGRRSSGGRSWKPVHSSARASGMHHQPATEKEGMVRKIEAILAEFGLPWSYADGIVMQQTRGRIERLRFCDAGQTRKVLQSLCVYQERQRKKNVQIPQVPGAYINATRPVPVRAEVSKHERAREEKNNGES